MNNQNKKYHLNTLLIGFIIFTLLGCGTLTRGNSSKITYRGTEQDLYAIQQPYAWMFSFGIAPLLFAASLPLDFAIDTVLYPIDNLLAYNKNQQKIKEKADYLRDYQELPVTVIDLTNNNLAMSLHISRSDQENKSIYGTLFPPTQQITLDDNLALPKHKTGQTNLIIKQELSDINRYKGKKIPKNEKVKSNEIEIIYQQPIPFIDANSKLLTLIFLPCYQIKTIIHQDNQPVKERLKQDDIQQIYKNLTKLQKQQRCPELINTTLKTYQKERYLNPWDIRMLSLNKD